jgi:7-keto-8-aminopelargonate synthetase-like enzyme
MDGVNSMTGNPPDLPAFAALARAHDALLYLDDAHGFGVIGQRTADEPCPYGRRGNGVVRHLGESYDNVVLTAGFSKAYSSLLAFVACPTALKRLLKVAAPPYLYSGPSPIASLASALVGLQINHTRGDQLRAMLYASTRRVLDHLDKLGATTLNTSGFPIIEVPLSVPRRPATRAPIRVPLPRRGWPLARRPNRRDLRAQRHRRPQRRHPHLAARLGPGHRRHRRRPRPAGVTPTKGVTLLVGTVRSP